MEGAIFFVEIPTKKELARIKKKEKQQNKTKQEKYVEPKK